jgi:Ca-activated chloride channel family protein
MRIPLLLAALLVAPLTLRAQLPAGVDDGGLWLSNPAGGYTPATRLNSEFAIAVTGIVGRVTLRQRFRNTGSEWVEGIYVFPLPDDAAVDRLTLEIGNRRIEGEIQEREQAKRTYDQARAAGQQASLVEQERSNLFTTSVANIAPGQEIVIEIGYLQTASFDDGQFELRVPMTLTPRFNPATVSDAARIAPPFRRATNGNSHQATIGMTIDAGMPLAEAGSPSHVLTARGSGERYRLSTPDPVPMNRDLVVSWRVVADQTPRVAAFTESIGDDSYLLLMFMPPATASLIRTTPREVIFVIDTSGSMEGNSMARARTALQSALGRLTPSDRFNVIQFNNAAHALFPEPAALGPQSLEAARSYVSGLQADGGTNIASALTLALGQPAMSGFLRQIVFITDGSVGNEAELFEMIRSNLGASRMFTVGIGTAPNTLFMRKAAQFGRGSYSHIARAEDVEPGMDQLFTKLEHVALTDIEIDWPDAAEIYPERIPDLYHGEPVVVAVRTTTPARSGVEAETSGRIGVYDWSERIRVTPGEAPGVASIWARRKIESLLDQRLRGEGENVIRNAVLEVALAHNMLSPYTSLVAVDRTPDLTRTAALRREALGNLPPDDGRMASFPDTATNAEFLQLIGTLLTALFLGLAGIARLQRRR